MIEHRVITGEDNRFQYEFAICTLVTSWEEYALMKSSFIDCGFSGNCEYLVADNTHQNASDAYQAIASFLATNRSRYLVIVHQDVRCIDHRRDLLSCLAQLTALDATWALCGNAGAQGYHNDIIHIMNNGKIVKSDNVPAKVNSLDENFLLINMNTSLAISADMSGFHLYGTDLAIIADFLGHSCYVIPFLVNHISLGNVAELKKQVPAFVS
ncbi:MAG: acyl esterase, partial [Sediminibacterium sp.]|nr:acyl esterase [Sediminibacterium sp.]